MWENAIAAAFAPRVTQDAAAAFAFSNFYSKKWTDGASGRLGALGAAAGRRIVCLLAPHIVNAGSGIAIAGPRGASEHLDSAARLLTAGASGTWDDGMGDMEYME